MLPNDNRMRRPAEFSAVLAGGRRSRQGSMIVHFLPDLPNTADVAGVTGVHTVCHRNAESAPRTSGSGKDPASPPIVGLVVGRAVGGSVVRHRVSRRLRAQLHSRLSRLPAASATVIRALPAAGSADSATLGRDLDAAFGRLLSNGRPAGGRRREQAGPR